MPTWIFYFLIFILITAYVLLRCFKIAKVIKIPLWILLLLFPLTFVFPAVIYCIDMCLLNPIAPYSVLFMLLILDFGILLITKLIKKPLNGRLRIILTGIIVFVVVLGITKGPSIYYHFFPKSDIMFQKCTGNFTLYFGSKEATDRKCITFYNTGELVLRHTDPNQSGFQVDRLFKIERAKSREFINLVKNSDILNKSCNVNKGERINYPYQENLLISYLIWLDDNQKIFDVGVINDECYKILEDLASKLDNYLNNPK